MLLNISFIVALGLQFASFSSHQAEDTGATLVVRMMHQCKYNDYESCIDKFSDLYHHCNTDGQVPQEDSSVALLGHHFEPEFLEKYLIDLLGYERRVILNTWMENFPPNRMILNLSEFFTARNANGETFDYMGMFFRREIRSLMGRKLDASLFIKSFVNGSGFCSIYKHPSDVSNDLDLSNENEVKMSKLGSLIANLQERNRDEMLWKDTLYTDMSNAVRQISIVCRSFMKYPLDENRRKRFFSALLDDIHENQTLHESSGPYVVGENRDICSKLVSIMLGPQERFFLNVNTTGFFLDECLEDLPKIFRFKLDRPCLVNNCRSLFDGWMTRIEDYMQRKLNVKPGEYKKLYDPLIHVIAMDDSNQSRKYSTTFPLSRQRLEVYRIARIIRNALNSQFYDYIRAVVEEVPSPDAQLAYEKGEGLCSILSNTIIYFGTITEILFKYGQNRSFSIGGGLVEDDRNVVDVVRFLLLHITCQSLRDKSKQDVELNLPDAKRRKIA